MIRSPALLKDLQVQVTRLQDALRTECDRFPASDGPLKERYTQAQAGKRTSLTYKAWREEELTQIAVGWVLATVFVRFLEDNGLVETLYQDLSESVRKKYALLQTPEFIETFILDRTLTPAIESFGFSNVRMIDPTCGSGHFCLGGFHRLFRLSLEAEPASNPRVLAQKALDGIFGVDLNPFAVAIARFRLLIAALGEIARVEGRRTLLKHAPDLRFHLAVGDSLLHGRRFAKYGTGVGSQPTLPGSDEEVFRDELKHHYEVEDAVALRRILGQQYHAVVGNPPYITVKDRAVSELYRARYPSCHRRYSLSVPFMERFFDLAVKGDGTPQQPAGFVGQITANTFMKREFGKKLIEENLPRWDLTHVLDTAGAYIPGHGTPTVILFGKNQPPVSGTIRTVLGIAGEPATPADPALGLVWQAIIRQIDEPGSVSEWMSAADSPRANFHRHPWSIGGGGASDLKTEIDEAGEKTLLNFVEIKRKKPNIGFASFTGLDEAFLSDKSSLIRARIESKFCRDVINGDIVRDWIVAVEDVALVPCDEDFSIVPLASNSGWGRYLWPNRTSLKNVESFETTREEEGLAWWGWYRWISEKYRRPHSITFGEIATHNHFAFDHGGNVFSRTAPVIKLKSGKTDHDHIQLLGVLNSSTACFYLKQVCHNKGSTVDEHGARQRSRISTLSTARSSPAFPSPRTRPRSFRPRSSKPARPCRASRRRPRWRIGAAPRAGTCARGWRAPATWPPAIGASSSLGRRSWIGKSTKPSASWRARPKAARAP